MNLGIQCHKIDLTIKVCRLIIPRLTIFTMPAVNFFVDPIPKESSEKRVSRFKQWYNRSRVGNIVKSRRYRKKKLSKRQEREAAVMRDYYRAKRERNRFYS